MPNVFAEHFALERDGVRGSMVARDAGARDLGATVYELAPHAKGMPLHIHHGVEELIIVLAGTPLLRTLDGERILSPGEVVACRRGRAGAHTVDNGSDEPARFLVVSTKSTADVVEYPEEGTVRAVTGFPWSPDPDRPREDQFSLLFERSSAHAPQT